MVDSNNRREIERFCDQYVCFWAFACILASVFVGWPAILAWVGLAGGMRVFRDALNSSNHSTRPDQSKPNRKCRD